MDEIDSFMNRPELGLMGEGDTATKQIRKWLETLVKLQQFDHLVGIVRACESFWDSPRHPHYTTHGLLHSGYIIGKLARWIGARDDDRLRGSEVFPLLGAAYLHDIGMQCKDAHGKFLTAEGIPPKDKQEDTAPGYKFLTIIRSKHAQLSVRLIKDACLAKKNRKCPEFELNAGGFYHDANLMADVSLYHSCPYHDIPASVRDEPYEPERAEPRRMLLIHLLRIGDALDADHRRLPENLLQSDFDGLDAVDQFHMLKHAYVERIELEGEGDFRFIYALPVDTKEMEDDIYRHCEIHVRNHIRDAGTFLNKHRFSIREVQRTSKPGEHACPISMTKDARGEFAKGRPVNDRIPTTVKPPPPFKPEPSPTASIDDDEILRRIASFHARKNLDIAEARAVTSKESLENCGNDVKGKRKKHPCLMQWKALHFMAETHRSADVAEETIGFRCYLSEIRAWVEKTQFVCDSALELVSSNGYIKADIEVTRLARWLKKATTTHWGSANWQPCQDAFLSQHLSRNRAVAAAFRDELNRRIDYESRPAPRQPTEKIKCIRVLLRDCEHFIAAIENIDNEIKVILDVRTKRLAVALQEQFAEPPNLDEKTIHGKFVRAVDALPHFSEHSPWPDTTGATGGVM